MDDQKLSSPSTNWPPKYEVRVIDIDGHAHIYTGYYSAGTSGNFLTVTEHFFIFSPDNPARLQKVDKEAIAVFFQPKAVEIKNLKPE